MKLFFTKVFFFVGSKGNNPKKLTKIVKIEEAKIYIFWEAWWIFSEKCNLWYYKWLQKKALHSLPIVWFLKFILRIMALIFFEWNFFIIRFCRINYLSIYLNKNKLKKEKLMELNAFFKTMTAKSLNSLH